MNGSPARAALLCLTTVLTSALGIAACGRSVIDENVVDAGFSDATSDGREASTPDAGSDVSSCSSKQTSCAGDCVDLGNDPKHCGRCDVACSSSQVCSGGTCAASCSSGKAECVSKGALVCVDPLNDRDNCGYCGNQCSDTDVCSNGTCQLGCGPDETRCKTPSGSAFCANLQDDPDSCGACDNACPHGPDVATVYCAAGKCGIACAHAKLDCDGDLSNGCEADPTSDENNCGSCGNVCALGASCQSRECECYAPYPGPPVSVCNGICTSKVDDPANCGACGVACQSSGPSDFNSCIESGCHHSVRTVTTGKEVTGVATSGEYVYYVVKGTGVYRVADDISGFIPELLATDTSAVQVATDGTSIFWIGANGVFACPITGCVGAPQQISGLSGILPSIEVDDTKVYFSFASSIYACPKTGCPADAASLASASITAFTVGSGGVLYWLDKLGLVSETTDATPTQTRLSFATSFTLPAFFADNLYFGNLGAVYRCDAATCLSTKPLTFNYQSYDVGDVETDGVSIYWTSIDEVIRKAPIAGGTYSVLGPLPRGATRMVVTHHVVSWGGYDGLYMVGK